MKSAEYTVIKLEKNLIKIIVVIDLETKPNNETELTQRYEQFIEEEIYTKLQIKDAWWIATKICKI